MFNYSGPNTGPSTVANTLPSGVPGTVPAGIPGIVPPGTLGSISPMGNIIPSRPPINPAMAAAIQPGNAPGAAPAGPPEPGDQMFDTHTQADGSVVIFLKQPDGSRGPAVAILPASKVQSKGLQKKA